MELAVALVGEDAAGVQALRMLVKHAAARPVAVFTGVARGDSGATVAAAAAGLDVPVRAADEVTDPSTGAWLRERETDVVLNVHSLHIVADEVLEAPRLGAFNLHPGPLPELAGLNSPSWALYNGATEHGVTLYRMTAGVDEGPIAFEDRFGLGPQDTGLTVLTQCVRRGIPLLERLLDCAASGEPIPAREQDLSGRRWFGHGPPEGGSLGWDRPAQAVVDFVRACDFGPFPSPWGRPRCAVGGREIGIAAATGAPGEADAPPGTVISLDGGDAIVAAADAPVRVTRVETDGKAMPAADALSAGERLEPAAAGAARR
jgi:UDP-4-amino-4-deoxy-L-arabinose formyltransferase/UDP-glucuronic acid dehydrogenase (UDP-4-keto-hexauronic acid decarboxylating)